MVYAPEDAQLGKLTTLGARDATDVRDIAAQVTQQRDRPVVVLEVAATNALIADPNLMKLIGPIHSQIVSLQLLFLLVGLLAIPIALNGKFALYWSSTKGQLSIEPAPFSRRPGQSPPDSPRNWMRWVLMPASS
mgnify:CR=1 FL=1